MTDSRSRPRASAPPSRSFAAGSCARGGSRRRRRSVMTSAAGPTRTRSARGRRGDTLEAVSSERASEADSHATSMSLGASPSGSPRIRAPAYLGRSSRERIAGERRQRTRRGRRDASSRCPGSTAEPSTMRAGAARSTRSSQIDRLGAASQQPSGAWTDRYNTDKGTESRAITDRQCAAALAERPAASASPRAAASRCPMCSRCRPRRRPADRLAE